MVTRVSSLAPARPADVLAGIGNEPIGPREPVTRP
jgi:hypothetical protein